MSMKKTLGAIVLAASLGGCGDSFDGGPYIYGTVLEESGTIVERQRTLEPSGGALFGNKSVKVGDPTYSIKFRREDNGKIYTFSVKPNIDIRLNRLDALALAIENGTIIGVRRLYFNHQLKGTVGSINDDEIEVFGKDYLSTSKTEG